MGLEPTRPWFKVCMLFKLERAQAGHCLHMLKAENQAYKLQEQLMDFRVYHSATVANHWWDSNPH